jgi:molybdopterin converting factor small subunit
MTEKMSLQVRLFSLLREQVGRDSIEVVLPLGSRVADLTRALRVTEPRLTPFLEVSRIAVNLAFAPREQKLSPEDDVALIPPVGGG